MTSEEKKQVKDLTFNGFVACFIILALILLFVLIPLALKAHEANKHSPCRVGAVVSLIPSGPMNDSLDAKMTRVSFGCIAPAENGFAVITRVSSKDGIEYLYIPKSLVVKVYFFKAITFKRR